MVVTESKEYMDGFSLEMAGGDLLDLGSFGLFGDNTTINSTSSPSSGIPLSLGTPTGVASLQAAQAAMYGDNEEVEKQQEHDTSLNNELSTADPTSESAASANQTETTTTTTSSTTSATDFFSTFTAQQNAAAENVSSPSGGGTFTKALDSIPTTLMGSSAMNMTQSSARPHIQASSVPMGGQSMPMGNPMSAGMMQQQHDRSPQNPGFNVYANEMASIKQQLMMQPDLIPPPPQVIHAGQQYMMMAARMGGQMYMPPQQQMMMQGQMGVGPPMYGGMPPNMMNVGHSPSAAMEAARQQQLRQQHLQQQRAQMAGGVQQVAWQSEADIPLRRKMIAKIVSLLQQRKPDAPPEWIKKLPDMARRLEDSLYRTASNRTEYGNFSTLKHRLQQLAITMGAKSARGRSAPPSHPVSSSMTSTPSMGGGSVSYSGGMQQFSGSGTPTHQQMMQQLQLQAQIQQMQAVQQAEMHRRNSIQMQQQQQVQAQMHQQHQNQQQQQRQHQQNQQTQAQPNTASPAPAPGTPQSQSQTTPNTTTDETSQPQQRNQTPIPDLQEVDDADFLNFDLSPSMGGALEFDLDRNTPPQQDTEKYGSENGSDT